MRYSYTVSHFNIFLFNFCKLNYKTSFDQLAKIDVNGENEDSLFRFLKQEKGGFMNDNIKWNFTKFLVSREGCVVNRYAPITKPEKIEQDIFKLL